MIEQIAFDISVSRAILTSRVLLKHNFLYLPYSLQEWKSESLLLSMKKAVYK